MHRGASATTSVRRRPVFNVPSGVVFAQGSERVKVNPGPISAVRFEGRLPKRNASASDAALVIRTSATLHVGRLADRTCWSYEKLNLRGASSEYAG